MRIELSRDDVEIILRKYMEMDTVVLNKNGSATVDTTLEKIVSDKVEQYSLPYSLNSLQRITQMVGKKWKIYLYIQAHTYHIKC